MAALDMIVAEAAAQIVSQKLDILLSHPVCVECVSMKAHAKDAKVKLATILEFISTQYRPPETTEWSEHLLQASYHAEKFIDKFYLREARERHEALRVAARPLPTLVSKYKLWRDLSELVNKMGELCDEKSLKEAAELKRKSESAGSSSHALVPWQGTKLVRLTSFWDRYDSIMYLYLKEKRVELMKRMRAPRPRWTRGTSILGMPGTGKTILARWVHSQAEHMDFGLRAWVHMWTGMDKRGFLLEILQQVEKLGGEMEDMDINKIKAMLSQKLVETRRFLIVLDGVKPSNEPILGEFAMIIPASSQGHIICTTGDEKIAGYVTDEEPIRLEEMPKEVSGEMLAWKLHRVIDGNILTNQEKSILKRCPRLPRCISLIGGILANAGVNERAALAQEGPMMTLQEILELSWQKLPVYLKPCFIYMALFPVTFPIPTRRLVRLWMAEGLLDSYRYEIEKQRTRQPEDVGETFILELADRNVIDVVSWRADGSPKACHMVVQLHEIIWPIAMSLGYLHVHAPRSHDPTNQQQQLPIQPREGPNIRWLAEHTNIVRGGSYRDLKLRHVSSFLSFYLRVGVFTKDISTFLGKMTSEANYSLLRVLDLEGVYKPSLQGVLHKLVLLRYLGLRSTVLDSLPSTVADLHFLETLDVKHTNITSLPSSLWKARNLRHLHLHWFYIDLKTILKACSNNVMALTQLQTLSGLVIGEVRENLMTGPMNSLTTLKLFLHQSDKDTSGAAGKAIADWISFRLINLQYLTFGVTKKAKPAEEEAKPATSRIISLLPKLSLARQHHGLLDLYLLGQLERPIWTELLPDSLRVLTLSGSKVEIDMMHELGGLLTKLRTFRLLANSFIGQCLKFIKEGFPSLTTLKMWKLPKLEKVIIEPGAMPHLRELEFRRLRSMKQVDGILECPELENIIVIPQSGADEFVDHLKCRINIMPHLFVKKETESMNDGEDDSDED